MGIKDSLIKGQVWPGIVGLQGQRGGWIAFLDSDDTWHSDKLAVQVHQIKNHPEIPFFYSGRDYIDEQGLPTNGSERTDVLGPLLYQGYPGAFPSTVILRKDVFLESGGFNPMLRVCEDGELFGRIALSWPLGYIARSLVRARMHPAQISEDKKLFAQYWPFFHSCLWKIWEQDSAKRIALLVESSKVYAGIIDHFLHSIDRGEARRSSENLLALWQNWSRKQGIPLPGGTNFLTHLGDVFINAGDYHEAAKYYRQGWILNPWSWSVFVDGPSLPFRLCSGCIVLQTRKTGPCSRQWWPR